MTRQIKEFQIKSTRVRLFENGTASISGPCAEEAYVNDYLRLEGFVEMHAQVRSYPQTDLRSDWNEGADLTWD